jgi:PEP-CTERM motif
VSEGTRPQTIAGAVSSIQGQSQFTLSATDTLSGKGNFIVVPEPATIGLLGVGLAVAIAFSRRRRLACRS